MTSYFFEVLSAHRGNIPGNISVVCAAVIILGGSPKISEGEETKIAQASNIPCGKCGKISGVVITWHIANRASSGVITPAQGIIRQCLAYIV